jgi:hypothetical protein
MFKNSLDKTPPHLYFPLALSTRKRKIPHPAAVRMRDLFFGRGYGNNTLNITIYRKLKP